MAKACGQVSAVAVYAGQNAVAPLSNRSIESAIGQKRPPGSCPRNKHTFPLCSW